MTKQRRSPRGSTLAERLKFHSATDPTTGCWLWTGAQNGVGYGLVTIPGVPNRKRSTHRASYEVFVGPIPEGLVLDHLCCVRHCMNPRHLEPVTHGENIRRAFERHRIASQGQAA